nr:MAG: acetylornithine transaminase [Bacillota bacterium]
MDAEAIQALDREYVMGTYSRYPIALVRGRGTRVWDAAGKEYLDFLGGIAVNVLGHCHPAVVRAIQAQAETLIHTSNLYYTEPMARLARALAAAGGPGKAFFCNSGAEANEGAFKLARKYHWRRGDRQRVRILSMTHAFHGRTLGALAATPKPAIQEGFGPLPPGFDPVPWGDLDALDRALDETVAAVILEPVQGEGGIQPADPEYLRGVRRLTRERGALLILDEIQCGMGRTGTFFAYQGYGVEPDIVTLAKGLGGGLPIGAILATPEVAAAFQPGDHGSTFGGNPVACAAALATVETILAEGLPARARELGEYFLGRLAELQARYPGVVAAVRGRGLMLGLVCHEDGQAGAVLAGCHRRGLLANVTAERVLRLLPPLTVTREEIDAGVAILDDALAEVAGAASGAGEG